MTKLQTNVFDMKHLHSQELLHSGTYLDYRLGPVNSKSFIGKVLLRIKWKFDLQYETIVKTFDLWLVHEYIWYKTSN